MTGSRKAVRNATVGARSASANTSTKRPCKPQLERSPLPTWRTGYHPDVGRFWTMDTFEGTQEDPLSLHTYLYCHDNPVNGTDPSGHEFTLTGQLTRQTSRRRMRNSKDSTAFIPIPKNGFGIIIKISRIYSLLNEQNMMALLVPLTSRTIGAERLCGKRSPARNIDHDG